MENQEKRSRRRILFVMHLPPPIHGAALMGQYIHDSELVNATFECRYVNLTTARALQDIGRPSWKKLWHFLRLLWQVRRQVRCWHPDCVYVTPNARGGAFYKDYLVERMLKRMGCRVVLHYHNKGVALRAASFPDRYLYRRFFKDVRVILLSSRLYADVASFVERERIFVCPNGIPPLPAAEMATGRAAAPQQCPPRLLFLSNLLRSKGVYDLLDACARLREEGVVFACSIVGGETAEMDAAALDSAIAQRGLQQVVTYQGVCYGREKHAAYSEADLLVFPSHDECFPLVLLEAMQHGLPCVATDVGGVSDMVVQGQTGLLVDPQDTVALAKAVGQLLADEPLRHAMGLASRTHFDRHFTLCHFEQRITEILQLCSDSEP